MKQTKPSARDGLLTLVSVLLLIFIVLQYVFHVDLISLVSALLHERGLDRPMLSEGAGLGIVFLYGLLSSIHCVGMCGGIVLSISANRTTKAGILQNLKYQAARILSYGLAGFLLGALGEVLSLSKSVQIYIPIVCGVLMLIMGISMLLGQAAFPVPKWYSRALSRMCSANVFVLGALNALLPCGTMQAVQFYAVASADALKGMAAMLLFALGTVPMLLLFGVLSSVFENRNWKWVLPLTSLLVIFLSVQMILRGIAGI